MIGGQPQEMNQPVRVIGGQVTTKYQRTGVAVELSSDADVDMDATFTMPDRLSFLFGTDAGIETMQPTAITTPPMVHGQAKESVETSSQFANAISVAEKRKLPYSLFEKDSETSKSCAASR